MTFPSKTLRWLKEGWEAEYVSDLGPSYVLHVRGSRKTAGKLVVRAERILDGAHILWTVERDLNTPGDWGGRGLRPKRGPDGKVVRRPEEWLQPFHEGVKRLNPFGKRDTVDLWEVLRLHWLGAYLRDRGNPCICGHRDIIAHLAESRLLLIADADIRLSEDNVRKGIERAAREAARIIGDRVPDNPLAIRVQMAHASAHSRCASEMG